MIGGTVVEVIELADRVWVNVVEDREGSDTHCAVYVEKNDKSAIIKPGDALWWQSGSAMWTPYANRGSVRGPAAPVQRGGVDYDIRIPRIGFSGVKRPVEHVG